MSCCKRTIEERKQTSRDLPPYTVFHGKSESAIRVAWALLEKSYGHSKWSWQCKPWSNWCGQIEYFNLSLPPCPHLAWPDPVRSHLPGCFHPAQNPPPATVWEQIHPALLPGDQSYFCFCHLWAARITLMLDPTVWLDGARPANTCILPSFPWMAPAHYTAYHHWKELSPSAALAPRVRHMVHRGHSREGGRNAGV
jgi:hypothetical protein